MFEIPPLSATLGGMDLKFLFFVLLLFFFQFLEKGLIPDFVSPIRQNLNKNWFLCVVMKIFQVDILLHFGSKPKKSKENPIKTQRNSLNFFCFSKCCTTFSGVWQARFYSNTRSHIPLDCWCSFLTLLHHLYSGKSSEEFSRAFRTLSGISDGFCPLLSFVKISFLLPTQNGKKIQSKQVFFL